MPIMSATIDPALQHVYDAVLRRNPSEDEFHQAVEEVLGSLGPVVKRHPHYLAERVIERICEPERQIIFRVPWTDDAGQVQINRGFRVGTPRSSVPTRAGCASTPPCCSAR